MSTSQPHQTLIFLLLGIRLLSAWVLPILDCDETYNYFEPLHRLMYGFGFQTWEYAPHFALRSFLYLWVHAFLIWPFHFILSKKNVFFVLRSMLALASAYTELQFVKQTQAPNLTLWFLIWAPGMFQASSAFLPSSFVMICMFWVLARQFHFKRVIVGIGIASLLGWPFAALLGLPFALIQLVSRFQRFVNFTFITFLMISIPMLLVDSYMYGRWTLTPFNLLQYNLLENKSYLYGVEPMSFYFKNLILNWSFLPCLAFLYWLKWSFPPYQHVWKWSFLLWLSVLLAQPHKEERFLFPLYPWIAWGASNLCDQLFSLSFFTSSWKRRGMYWVGGGVYCCISILRCMGLVHYYSAPLHLNFTSPSIHGMVCLGPEWHLFPGHFLVSSSTRLGFVPFQAGELPDLFDESPLPYATRKQVQFNGWNQVHPDRFKSLQECDYYIGVQPPLNSNPIQCVPMLDSARTTMLHRILYHPLKRYQVWTSFCLFKNEKSMNNTRTLFKIETDEQ